MCCAAAVELLASELRRWDCTAVKLGEAAGCCDAAGKQRKAVLSHLCCIDLRAVAGGASAAVPAVCCVPVRVQAVHLLLRSERRLYAEGTVSDIMRGGYSSNM